jgi:adenylate cyclase, class 2
MQNYELKARYPDLEKGRQTAEELGARYAGLDHQTDTYFQTREGRLKLRESSLSGSQLIPYLRAELKGPKKSLYSVLPVTDPQTVKNLFAGILGVDTVVEKKRHIYLYENVRIHLDEVAKVGRFLEFEAVYQDLPGELEKQQEKIATLIQLFKIKKEDLLQGSYREMGH